MKFYITMHMPSHRQAARQGDAPSPPNMVHQMIVDHPSRSLEEFADALQEKDFIIVQEFYRNNQNPTAPLTPQGEIAINYRYVGKIRVYNSVDKATM